MLLGNGTVEETRYNSLFVMLQFWLRISMYKVKHSPAVGRLTSNTFIYKSQYDTLAVT